MRFGNIGRPLGMKGFYATPVPRSFSRPVKFWASRAHLGADGYRHIRNVIGPDEYHQHVDDNAFTNVMARWNIRRAIDVVALLRKAGQSAGQAFQAGSAWMTLS